ncbi:MAG: hypothetical protein K0B87_07565 [Candidatus Syntrophosphaera sp.]|nr:hypothetical protein [Candidatus Syntrophosphaera sp.]
MLDIAGLTKTALDYVRNIFSDAMVRKSKAADIISEIAVNTGILSEFTRKKNQKCDREIACKVVAALKHEAWDEFRRNNLDLKSSFRELVAADPAKPLHLEIRRFYETIAKFGFVIANLEATGVRPNYRQRLTNLRDRGLGIIRELNRSIKKTKNAKRDKRALPM